jgi:hypothetical protein
MRSRGTVLLRWLQMQQMGSGGQKESSNLPGLERALVMSRLRKEKKKIDPAAALARNRRVALERLLGLSVPNRDTLPRRQRQTKIVAHPSVAQQRCDAAAVVDEPGFHDAVLMKG